MCSSDLGMLASLPEDITSAVPPAYTSADGNWVGLTGRARVIAYDSQTYTADDIPGDVFELTQPQWRGKVAIVPSNASFQAFVTALRVQEGEDRARQWLTDMVANDAQVYSKNGEVLEAAFKLPPSGPIGLEADRDQMEYRHIQLKELP